MDAPSHVTERWLAEHAPLTPGGELRLPASSRLTPAARDLLDGLRIRVRYADESGRVFVDAAGANESAEARQQVHPLTGRAGREAAHCALCNQPVDKKTNALTHLNAATYVAKNDPRIVFRGRVDSAIAQAVLLQAEWRAAGRPEILQNMLADVRAALGNVLRAEATSEAMPPIVVGGFDEAQIHRLSHDPLTHLSHDHLVPAVEHGLDVARLNVLRSAVREAELSGAQAFIDRDFTLSRADVLHALNRLSSAVYVLMILCWIAGKPARSAA